MQTEVKKQEIEMALDELEGILKAARGIVPHMNFDGEAAASVGLSGSLFALIRERADRELQRIMEKTKDRNKDSLMEMVKTVRGAMEQMGKGNA